MNCQPLNDIKGLQFIPVNGMKYIPRQKGLPKISCIYKILSKCTGKVYVGSAKNFAVRMRNHVSQLEKNKHHSIILQNHVNKYTTYDLVFIILEVIEWGDNAYEYEQKYIDLLKPYFNVLPNARTCKGRKATQETIQKIISSHLGIKQTELSKQRRSFSMMVAASKLTQQQKENRLKGSACRQLPIICNETGVKYNSVIEAERLTGCKNVSAICKGKRSISKGFTFNYLNQ